jgi:aldose 1-epimerase
MKKINLLGLLMAFILFSFLSFSQNSNKPMAPISSKSFGKTPSGESVTLFTMKNASGMEVQIMNYGGIITKILTPDKNGIVEDVVLGFETLDEYIKENPFFGASVGRYGNRIAKGKFTLDGVGYQLPLNNNGNSLHGGLKGFDKKVWQVISSGETAEGPKIVLKYISTDMEEGFPGNLTVHLSYILTAKNELSIEFSATTDKATVINLCNHSYFNLSGNGKQNVLAHTMQLNAPKLVAVDNLLIPTGELIPVAGTPFDFLTPQLIGSRIDQTDNEQIKRGGGYDHCFAFDKPLGKFAVVAIAHDPVSGRTLEASTTEPGVQLYTGNFLDGHLKGKNGAVYGKRSGFCLETQHYPDSPNRPNFPSTVLRPGNRYTTKTNYKFFVQ